MNTKTRLIALLAAVACVSGAAPLAIAHHSFGLEFDADKPVTLTGTVTSVEWTNPHSYFYLDIADDEGAAANWQFSGYPPVVLYRTGWTRDVTLQPGDQVSVFGWRARDDTDVAHARQVTFADGSKLFFGPPAGTGDGGSRPAVELN